LRSIVRSKLLSRMIRLPRVPRDQRISELAQQ
jgi:hypothetical protein